MLAGIGAEVRVRLEEALNARADRQFMQQLGAEPLWLPAYADFHRAVFIGAGDRVVAWRQSGARADSQQIAGGKVCRRLPGI